MQENHRAKHAVTSTAVAFSATSARKVLQISDTRFSRFIVILSYPVYVFRPNEIVNQGSLMEKFGFRSLENPEDWKKWVLLHVKAISSEISDQAGRRAQSVLGDSADAQCLMESAVAVVSRYLISKHEPLWPGRTKTLLRASFRRALRRRAVNLSRREMFGGTDDVEDEVLAFQNSGLNAGCRLSPERVVRLISDKSRAMLAMRDAGYNWKEIGRFFGVSDSAARKTFHEELRLAIQIADHPESRQAELEIAKRAQEDGITSEVGPFAKPIWE
jgi:hypothetical protein